MVVALSTCSCGLGGVLVYMHVIYRVCIRAFSGPLLFSYTVLSRANAHGRSQLKRQNLGWAVTRKKCLNRSNYFRARAHPGYEVGSHGPEPTCIDGSSFVKATPTVEKAVSGYKADRLVASLLSFRSVQSSPAVREFRAAGEKRCGPGHGQVCANLMSWRPKRIRTM